MGVAIIHVVDEETHTSKDFRCDMTLLLSHMKLLAADLTDVPGHDIQITVKCDIPTFAWLMAYVKAAGARGQQQQETTTDNCLQLLLASHYLQMVPVLRSSVAFIAAHLLSLPQSAAAQLCTMEGCLLDKLAKAVQEETLEALYHANCNQQQQHHQQQPDQHQQQGQQGSNTAAACSNPAHSKMQDAGGHSSGGRSRSRSATITSSSGSSSSACMLVEKLYKHKLRSLLQQCHTTLLCCSVCGELFASASHSKLQCAAAGGSTPAASSRLNKLPLHQPDPTWELQSYLTQQRTAPQQQHTSPQPTATPQQQQQQHGQVNWVAPEPSLQQQQQHGMQQPQQQEQDRADARSWRELYWLVWGHVVVLYCQRCCCHFPARLLHHCRYHPLPAVFESDAAPGRYPCCGAQAWQPGGNVGGGAAAAAAASALQGCSSRDHEAYLPAGAAGAAREGGSAPGRAAAAEAGRGARPTVGAANGSVSPGGSVGGKGTAKQPGGKAGAAGVDAGRALQLLQLFGPLITTAAPVVMQQPQQQQQQQWTAPVLPLLVKMVNRGAASAAAAAGGAAGDRAVRSPTAAAAAAACCDSAGNGSSSKSRPTSVQHLPPIVSPRQLLQEECGDTAASVSNPGSKHHKQQQPQEFSLNAAAAAAVAAAARASAGQASSNSCCPSVRRPMTAGTLDGESSRSGAGAQDSDAACSDADSSRRSRESSAYEGSEDDVISSRSSNSSSGSDAGSPRTSQGNLEGLSLGYGRPSASQAGVDGCECGGTDLTLSAEGECDLTLSAGPTPLSSVMGAVRAAAEWRTKGMGAFGSSGGGVAAGCSSGAGLLLQGQRSAPLAETFSAGGRRVLSPPKRRPLGQQGQADTSRPSTAASLLSLNNQQQQQRWSGLGAQPGAQQQQQSRPGTGCSSSSIMWGQRGADRAGRRADAGAAGSMGGAAAAAGAGVPVLGVGGSAINRTLLLELVQQDDAYRMGVLMRKLDSLRLQPPPDGVATKQQGQLSQVDVMRAVNGAVFQSKYKV